MRRAKRPPRSLVYSFTGLLVCGFRRLLVNESARLLVRRATCLRVQVFTCLRICALTRLRIHLSASSRAGASTNLRTYSFADPLVRGFRRRRVHLSTGSLVYLLTRRHNCPRTAGRICASSSTTRARSKPSRITARMVSSPAMVPQRLSGLWASISVVMLVA